MMRYFVFFRVGNMVSPQLFKSTEAPRYDVGLRAMLVAMAIYLTLNALLEVYFVYENRRLDSPLAATSREMLEETVKNTVEFLGKTDFQDSLKDKYKW